MTAAVTLNLPFTLSDCSARPLHTCIHRMHSIHISSACIIRDLSGATEIAGVDNVARAKKQGLKTREWTSRHEETGVDNAGVSDREK